MSRQIMLPHDWEARHYQIPPLAAFDAGILREFLVWHRRAGKDSYGINKTAKASHQRIGMYVHLLPTARQARKVVWNAIDRQGRRVIDQAFPKDLRQRTVDDEMMIVLKNGSLWQLAGSDNYDTLVGTNPIGIVASEWSISNPLAWDYLRPILAENGGWATFIGTPRGRNFFYDQYQLAKKNPQWFSSLLTVEDTGVISREIIEEERKSGMPENRIQQEYYCSFDAKVTGNIFGEQLDAMEANGRIGRVPHDPRYQVETSWDLGHRDATAICFWQNVGKAVHLIDYVEERGGDLAHFVKVVHRKPYAYSRHIGPHDTNRFEFGAGGTVMEQAKQHGLNFTIAPKLPVSEGIESTRSFLPRVYIDADNCSKLLRAMRAYEYEVEEGADGEPEKIADKPGPKWATHGCDSVRYRAVTPDWQGLTPSWAQTDSGLVVPYGHNGGPPLEYDPLSGWR